MDDVSHHLGDLGVDFGAPVVTIVRGYCLLRAATHSHGCGFSA